ncbi:MAG: shikimate kinase [Cyanobacterium sp. T60_A2020_053]|nr:shikimate kinase [Cyanobacterium sp. T60_A2020_053]
MQDLLQGLNIYLVGMMGAGKSTVGKFLAHRLGYRFLDTDSLIEIIANKSIKDIFAEEGETYFRSLEHRILSEVASYTRTVVSTGGGIVLNSENWGHLQTGMVIWLNASVAILSQRLENDQNRPLLLNQNLAEKLTVMGAERKSFYQQADLTIVQQKGQTTDEIVEEILRLIPTKIKPQLKPELN